jgi:hypothetical protein
MATRTRTDLSEVIGNPPPILDTRRIGNLFLQLLPLAIVCALSPWAIVAVILMLASDRPSNSVGLVRFASEPSSPKP